MLTPQADFRARQRQKQCQSPSRSAFSSDHSANNVDDADGDEDEDDEDDYCGGDNMIQGITAIVLETSQQLIRKMAYTNGFFLVAKTGQLSFVEFLS